MSIRFESPRRLVIGVLAYASLVRALPAPGQCSFDWRLGEGIPGLNDSVYAATTWDPDGPGGQPELLVVGGDFTVAGQVIANRVAAWDGASWRALGAGLNDTVRALTVFNGELIAAGDFTTAGNTTASRIARWNGTDWSSLGTGVSSGLVYSLGLYNGELIAGGSFAYAGGIAANRIARWNGAAWGTLGTGMDQTGCCPFVFALAVYNGELVAGGNFASAGGVSTSRIARWNGAAWQAVGMGTNGAVRALTVHNDELIAGGSFGNAGGVPASSIAHWNGTTWLPSGPA